MKIEPPTEIIEQGTPQQERKQEKRGVTKMQYDFNELRADFNELREKVGEKLAEMRQEIKNITNKVNSQGNKIQGYSIKELAQLKALGIRPQSILSGNISLDDEKAQESKNNTRHLSEMQRNNINKFG